MHHKFNANSLVVAMGTVVAAKLVAMPACAAENPFASSVLAGGYAVAESHEGEGRCGEGKCGANRAGAGGKQQAEGKCGEGRCGVTSMDADKDGSVSSEEFMKKHEEMFANMDANGDGAVSGEEMKAAHEGKCGEGKCGVEK